MFYARLGHWTVSRMTRDVRLAKNETFFREANE